MPSSNSPPHDRVGIYATFLRVGVFWSLFGAARPKRDCPRTPISRFRATVMRCKSWIPVLSLRQGTTRTSKSIEPRVSRIGRCILNHVLIIRRIFGVIKQKMRQSIAILLLCYCDSIVVAFFSVICAGICGIQFSVGRIRRFSVVDYRLKRFG